MKKILILISITSLLLFALSFSYANNNLLINETRATANCPLCNFSNKVNCVCYISTINQECYANYPACRYDYTKYNHSALCNNCNNFYAYGEHRHWESAHSRCAIINSKTVCPYI